MRASRFALPNHDLAIKNCVSNESIVDPLLAIHQSQAGSLKYTPFASLLAPSSSSCPRTTDSISKTHLHVPYRNYPIAKPPPNLRQTSSVVPTRLKTGQRPTTPDKSDKSRTSPLYRPPLGNSRQLNSLQKPNSPPQHL